MKVAVLEFPTKCLIGIVSDGDAALLADEFSYSEESVALEPEDESGRGALIRLQYPARNESTSWFQPGPLAGEQQFVVQNFVALTGATRMTVDIGAAIAADVFETVDGTTALIGGDGVTPAGAPTSDEPIVQRYLASLASVGVKPVRSGGRQKVSRETS